MKKLLFGLIITLLSACHNENYVRSRVVQLYSDQGSCTGTQINLPSGKTAILTAGHCKVLQDKDGNITVKLDGGRGIPRRVLEESMDTDLLLLEGMPGLTGVTLGDEPSIGTTLSAYTHGEGMPTYRSLAELLDKAKLVEIMDGILPAEGTCIGKKYSIQDVFFGKACFIKITAYALIAPTIRPGSSGGGFFNSKNELVAVVSASDSMFVSAVPLKDIKAFLSSY